MAVGLALQIVGERGWGCAALVDVFEELAEWNGGSTSVMEDSLIGLDGRLIRDILLLLLMLLLFKLSSLGPPGWLLVVLAQLVFKSVGMLLEKTEGSTVSLGRDLDAFHSGFFTLL